MQNSTLKNASTTTCCYCCCSRAVKKSFKRNEGRTGHMNGGGFGEAKNHGIVKLQVVGKTRDQSARNDRK